MSRSFRGSFVSVFTAALLTLGCAQEPVSDALDSPETGSPGTGTTAPGEVEDATPRPGMRFDPSTLKPGDLVGPLRVTSVEVNPIEGEPGWTGTVLFSGQISLQGQYEPHPAYPEVDDLCFFVDHSSAVSLPRFENDQRKSWFCFSNQEEAKSGLDQTPATGRATIVIYDFHYQFFPTDAYNTARLVEVIEKGPAPAAMPGGGAGSSP